MRIYEWQGIALVIKTAGVSYQTSPWKFQLYTVVRVVYIDILRFIS